MKVSEVWVEDLPQSKYTMDFACPKCGTYYADYGKVRVCYFKLPTKDTIAGVIPKDGAVEVHCDCGQIFWMHIDVANRTVNDDETIVPPYKKIVEGRGKHNRDDCSVKDCKFCHGGKCCFGGWNAGLGCYMDMDEGEFDNLVETMIGARTVKSAIRFNKKDGDSE